MARQRKIPEGARKISHKHSEAVVYVYETDGVICAKAYRTNRTTKPTWHYSFKTEKSLEVQIGRFFETEKNNYQYKKEEKKRHTLKVGDILSASWGYNQTNVDFFEVVNVVGKATVEIRELCQKREVGPMGDNGTCLPIKGEYKGELMRRRPDGHNYVSVCGAITASKWSGNEMHWSSTH